MTPAKLRALLELCERATPGPWRFRPGERECDSLLEHDGEDCDDCYWMTPPSVDGPFTEDCGDYIGLSEANATLIAAMRNHFAALARLALAARDCWHEGDDPCGFGIDAVETQLDRSQRYADELDAALAAVFGGDDEQHNPAARG